MKTLVVYDSIFGNTKKIAEAVATGFGPEAEAVSFGSMDAAAAAARDLVIVGSPTRGFRPTPAAAAGLKRLLAAVSVRPADSRPRSAVFDTRMDAKLVNVGIFTFMSKIFGYAADGLAKAIRKNGGKLAAEPAWFYVMASEGPLKDGEPERARAWGESLAAKLGGQKPDGRP